MFDNIGGFIIDFDGAFFKDFHILPGGKDFIEILKNKEIPFVFLSNLTTKTPDELHELLFRVGIYIDKNQIITSSLLARNYLKENYPDANVKVYGSKALKSVIYQEYKIGVVDVDVIVIGMDPKISIDDLSKIRKHIQAKKKVIFTNPDYYSPTSTGYDFECGVMLELFKPHLHEEPEIIGKPSKYAFDFAIRKLNIPKEYIAMVGDTYETDIKGAHDWGLIPIHLQTTNDDSYNTLKLDAYEYKNLEDLCTHFKSVV
ncbi:HAD hydrolase-like protein [Halarcobacter sp.]|uniref:HAD-IIA family hydrolase n=1 Tax=Halarcobacter sp. TaxID=2321133 RepID=UPI002AAB29E2|nr:HAD hydrolase-like protein [Halarcobacter sp.]